MIVISEPVEFEWDKGNLNKNNRKHRVQDKEAEEVFSDNDRFIFTDKLHSENEERFRIIGKTQRGRILFIVFTIRHDRIRIISARDINKKEVFLYEKKTRTAKV